MSEQAPQGFPTDLWDWLQALGPTASEVTWGRAWEMATRSVTLLSPYRHLTRYLSYCSRKSRQPSAVAWIGFLVEDEQKEAREIQVQVETRLRQEQDEEARREAEPESLRRWKDWVQG